MCEFCKIEHRPLTKENNNMMRYELFARLKLPK